MADSVLDIEISLNNAYIWDVLHYARSHETIRNSPGAREAATESGCSAPRRQTVSGSRSGRPGVLEFGGPLGAGASTRQAEGIARPPDARPTPSALDRAEGDAEATAPAGRPRRGVPHRALDPDAHRQAHRLSVRRSLQPGRHLEAPARRVGVELAEARTPGRAA